MTFAEDEGQGKQMAEEEGAVRGAMEEVWGRSGGKDGVMVRRDGGGFGGGEEIFVGDR